MKINLWFDKETELARRYSTVPDSRHPTESEFVWIPKSVIEHTTKNPPNDSERPLHIVEVQDWFCEKEGL